jgi:hypothetical protein
MSHNHETGPSYRELKTSEIIKQFFFSRIKKTEQKQEYSRKSSQTSPNLPPAGATINHIAIILDGRVEEVIRCENRLAALLLSEPRFVEFNPDLVNVYIGKTEYEGDSFKNVEPEIFSEKEMDDLIKKEMEKRKDD